VLPGRLEDKEVTKEVVGGNGETNAEGHARLKVKRKWDKAKTPYQRLLEVGALVGSSAERLALLYAQTNPRKLRREIYESRDALFDQAEPKAVATGV
jgi:hypothetical protein